MSPRDDDVDDDARFVDRVLLDHGLESVSDDTRVLVLSKEPPTECTSDPCPSTPAAFKFLSTTALSNAAVPPAEAASSSSSSSSPLLTPTRSIEEALAFFETLLLTARDDDQVPATQLALAPPLPQHHDRHHQVPTLQDVRGGGGGGGGGGGETKEQPPGARDADDDQAHRPVVVVVVDRPLKHKQRPRTHEERIASGKIRGTTAYAYRIDMNRTDAGRQPAVRTTPTTTSSTARPSTRDRMGPHLSHHHRYEPNPPLRKCFSRAKIELYKDMFRQFDQDGSGEIDASELHFLLESVRRCNVQRDEASIRAVLAECDENGNASYNFSEFLMLVHKLEVSSGEDMLAQLEASAKAVSHAEPKFSMASGRPTTGPMATLGNADNGVPGPVYDIPLASFKGNSRAPCSKDMVSFSFPHEERFPDESTTPGPGDYHHAERTGATVGQVSGPPAETVAFSSTVPRTGILGAFLDPRSSSTHIASTRLAPHTGPACYDVKDGGVCIPAPTVQFSKGTRAVPVASQLKTGDSPGPAMYNTAAAFGSSPTQPAVRFATAKQRPRPEESMAGCMVISAKHARANLCVDSPGPKYFHPCPSAAPQFSMSRHPHCLPQKSKADGMTDQKRKKEMKRVSKWVSEMIGPDVHVPRSQSEKILPVTNAFRNAKFASKEATRS
jgi:hypothetical protein